MHDVAPAAIPLLFARLLRDGFAFTAIGGLPAVCRPGRAGPTDAWPGHGRRHRGRGGTRHGSYRLRPAGWDRWVCEPP